MRDTHESSGPPAQVREPVQVYLGPDQQERLARLQAKLDTTKSEVLRKGLEALERQLTDPARHPALSVVGLFASEKTRAGSIRDAAREHDEVLSEEEMRSWGNRSDEPA